MSPEHPPAVEPCHCCGQPAELPAVGTGHLAGQEEEHVPLCTDCLGLLLTEPARFWEGMRRKGHGTD